MSKTTGGAFARAHHAATRRVAEDNWPSWFAKSECYRRAPSLATQYKLPQQQLLTLALTLYLALIGPPPFTRREIKVAFLGAQSSLQKAHKHLELLEDVGALPGESSVEHFPDGSIEVTFEPTAIELFQQQLRQLVAQLRQSAERTKGKSGQRISYLHYAVRVLVALIEEHNPTLRLAERERLCEELFDEVRQHAMHGRSDEDELPSGYRTLLKRVAERRKRVGSQSSEN
jgi:hypothetical protein